MNNGHLTPELAEKILNGMATVDDGNETIMTDIFTTFIRLFPEHRELANKVYSREIGRPFREYQEKASRRGY